MSRETRLSTFSFVNLLTIVLLMVVVGIYEVHEEQSTYRTVENSLRQQWFNAQQRLLRSEATSAVTYIHFRIAQTKIDAAKDLLSRTNQTLALATSIYSERGHASNRMQVELRILSSVLSLSERPGEGSRFILTPDGVNLLATRRSSPGARTGLSARTARAIASRFRALAKASDGKPVTFGIAVHSVPYRVCAAEFHQLGWIVGSLQRTSGVPPEALNDIITWMKRLKFGDDGHLAIFNTHLRLIADSGLPPSRYPLLYQDSGLKGVAGRSGKHFYVEMLHDVRSSSRGFVRYLSPYSTEKNSHERLAYVQLLPALGWIVEARVDTSTDEAGFAPYTTILKHHARRVFISLLLMVLLAAVLSVVLNRFFHRRIQRAFRLFNDAFRQSTFAQVAIDPDRMRYSELKQLSWYVNRIVDDLKAANERTREADARFQQAQKMEAVGRLAGGIAHDFNNLLTVIVGYAEMSLMDAETGETSRSALEEIHASAQLAASLTQQLLAFSRKQPVQPITLDLDLIVEDLGGLMRSILGENVQIILRLRSNGSHIKADANQVERVILNLVVNARDAMPRGGKLFVSVHEVDSIRAEQRGHSPPAGGRYVALEVRDTGIGMSQETMRHIFEPFFTTKEEGKGTGLGLSTVFGIAQQSGAHIEVDSTPGDGSTFVIYFPRVEADTKPTAVAAPPSTALVRRRSVLVVEDAVNIREMITGALRQAGYTAYAASNGTEALTLLTNNGSIEIDLILTDVVMPDMGGPQFIERLPERLRNCKVIFMSGYSAEAIPPGMTSIAKPFSPRMLLAKIAEVIGYSTDVGKSPLRDYRSAWYTIIRR